MPNRIITILVKAKQYKIIACNIFFRELSYCAAQSPHTIDLEFFELGEHVHCDKLHKTIQTRIDQAEQAEKHYAATAYYFNLFDAEGRICSSPVIL